MQKNSPNDTNGTPYKKKKKNVVGRRGNLVVTTTIWEVENSICYQVEVNDIAVVRRGDNNMINGTKLLNVTKMTRGRRDGILKSESIRHIIKIGSLNLKGVGLPFERALLILKCEKIADKLYQLFVDDI